MPPWSCEMIPSMTDSGKFDKFSNFIWFVCIYFFENIKPFCIHHLLSICIFKWKQNEVKLSITYLFYLYILVDFSYT